MRILIATDSFAPKIDGVADTTAILSTALARRGHRVTVVAPGSGSPRLGGAHIVRLPSIACPLYPELRLATRFGALRRTLERTPPDAAIVMTTGPVGLMAVRTVPRGVPLLHVYTTDMTAYARAYGMGLITNPLDRVLRWVSERAESTLCPTEPVRADLEARGHPRLEVWGRGVDGELFHPTRASLEMRHRLTGGDTEAPLLLYVGRLAKEKRLSTIREAARHLPGVRLAFVGDGPERQSLERQFAGLPAHFTGYLRGEELAGAFASADAFLFPSDTDTFGQVVLQAMASGVPPLVVRGTAAASLVPEGTGIHFEAKSGIGLALGVRELLANDVRRTAMSRAAHLHAQTFSWPRLVDRVESILGAEHALPIAI